MNCDAENGNEMATIDDLPAEILEKIFLELPLMTKKDAREVSSYWNAVMERHVCYHVVLNDSTLPMLSGRSYLMCGLTVELDKLNLPQQLPENVVNSIQPVKILFFKAAKGSELARLLDEFDGKRLVLEAKVIDTFINACKNIHTLRFDQQDMETYHINGTLSFAELTLQHLTTLQVKVVRGGSKVIPVALFGLEIPHLQNLEVERLNLDTAVGKLEDEYVFTNMLKCIVRHKLTLRALKLIRFTVAKSSNATGIMGGRVDLAQLAQVKLQSLEVDHLAADLGNGNCIAVRELLINQQSLKTFKLSTDCPDLLDFACSRIARNTRGTLSTLELNIQHPADRTFQMAYLSTLTSVTNLTCTFPTHTSFVPEFGPFPPMLQKLTWNAPMHRSLWYLSELTRANFPNLVTLTLGPYALVGLALETLCRVIFFYGDHETPLQELIIDRESENHDWLMPAIQEDALHLPTEIYRVEQTEEIIRVFRI